MRWKYKVVALSSDAQADVRELTKLGTAGWELIAVQRGDQSLLAYLQLEAEEPPRPKIRL